MNKRTRTPLFHVAKRAKFHFGQHFKLGFKVHFPFGGAINFADVGAASQPQPRLLRRLVEGFAHHVVHHLVAHRGAIALFHDAHGHLARTEAVHLEGARQTAQAFLHLALHAVQRQAQGHAAFKFFKRFHVDSHDVFSCSSIPK